MHQRSECKHGVLVEQCRCPGPGVVTIVPCPPSCDKKQDLTDQEITRAAYEQIIEGAQSMLDDWIDEEGEYSREDYFKIRKRASWLLSQLREKDPVELAKEVATRRKEVLDNLK